MFSSGDGKKVNFLCEAVTSYIKETLSIISMTPVDASNCPEAVKHKITSSNSKATGKPGYTQLKVGDYVRKTDKRIIFSKGYTSNWN